MRTGAIDTLIDSEIDQLVRVQASLTVNSGRELKEGVYSISGHQQAVKKFSSSSDVKLKQTRSIKYITSCVSVVMQRLISCPTAALICLLVRMTHSHTHCASAGNAQLLKHVSWVMQWKEAWWEQRAWKLTLGGLCCCNVLSFRKEAHPYRGTLYTQQSACFAEYLAAA